MSKAPPLTNKEAVLLVSFYLVLTGLALVLGALGALVVGMVARAYWSLFMLGFSLI